MTLVTYVASQNQPARRPIDVGTVVLIAVATGALAARRRRPVALLGVVFAAILVYFVVGYANGPIWLALIVAYVTAVLRGHRLAAAITAVIGSAVFPWLDFLIRDGQAPSAVVLAGLAAWLLVLLSGAEIVRFRRERAAEAIRIHEEESLRRASEERLRIARELHDALGHHLSLISVQSGVALHPRRPDGHPHAGHGWAVGDPPHRGRRAIGRHSRRVLTTFGLNEYVFEAIRSGASGFLVKDTEPEELVQVVQVVAGGEALLSPRVTRQLIAEFASRAKNRSPLTACRS